MIVDTGKFHKEERKNTKLTNVLPAFHDTPWTALCNSYDINSAIDRVY